MGYTVDIDTGSTFTDGFFTRDGDFRTVKAATTPHDLTLCFIECIRRGAEAFGLSLAEMLAQTELIRFSSTIGTNCIIQRDGAKLGLLLTAGNESLAPCVDSQGKAPLIADEMVAGIDEETTSAGHLRKSPDPVRTLAAAQELIDRGARCIVVALVNSEVNPANERAVRDIIKREYPRDYLGSVPVFLASDISRHWGYHERLNTAVLNAYTHGKLVRLLYRAGEETRRNQYRGRIFIGHNNGAVACVARTRAINTYNSGPAAGLLGARAVGELYGAQTVISADMGGTSFDLGCVVDGEPSYALRPNVEGFRCNLPMLAVRALGFGGGSIASVRDGELTVGPRSAGAIPGPACFDLGGDDATVSDADLMLGLLDPDFFLGGRKRLAVDRARSAIESKIAKPLGISVEHAALRIREAVEDGVAREIRKMRPAEGKGDPLMVVYGGGGPLYSCAIAARAGIRRLVVTPFSAVFSAFSSSLLDVGHLYYRRVDVDANSERAISAVAAAVEEMKTRAGRDMHGEGYRAGDLRWKVEFIVRSQSDGDETRLSAAIDMDDPVASIARALRQIAPASVITVVGLLASAPIPHFHWRKAASAKSLAADAIKKSRRVLLHESSDAIEVPVYDRGRLAAGHESAGPALVESEQTTMLVPERWRLRIDEYDNVLLES